MTLLPRGVKVHLASASSICARASTGSPCWSRVSCGRILSRAHLFVFRGRKAQQATFYIQFSFCGDCVSLAPTVRTNPTGIAIPTRQGFDLHLHG